ncbi:hypothetical protein ACN47E_003390 [Coniothyrium glycines]
MPMPPANIPISVHGRYLWRGDRRFCVRGVVYQDHAASGPRDLISDESVAQLRHDITLFKELGLNTIYVYFIDNEKPHDQAMKLLEDAGIYVYASLTTPQRCINRMSPDRSYKPELMRSVFNTIDLMAKYTNTLGVEIANCLFNQHSDLDSIAPVLKIVVCDVKMYMDIKHQLAGQRALLISYSGNSNEVRDDLLLEYLSSGHSMERIDLWTCTRYSWQSKDHAELMRRFERTKAPVFFSEYSSGTQGRRTFEETSALYFGRMNKIFSGGCAYEFSQGANGYGLIQMLRSTNFESTLAFEEAVKKIDESRRASQKVETDHGLLVKFRDFDSYKASLAAVEDVYAEEKEADKSEDTVNICSWEPRSGLPGTCVDWERLAEEIMLELETGQRKSGRTQWGYHV